MIQSRCGLCCQTCEYKDSMGCMGCLAINKPFWGEACPVKSCCENKQLSHCGECTDFPCALLHEFSYDPKQGDGGARIHQCACWRKETMKG